MTPEQRKHDDDLLRRDFIGELGGSLIIAANAINTAAAGDDDDLLELAIRQARKIVVDIIDEFKTLSES